MIYTYVYISSNHHIHLFTTHIIIILIYRIIIYLIIILHIYLSNHYLLLSNIYIYTYILDISLTWIKAIWGWFPLLTMISGFGRSEVVIIYPDIYIYIIYIYINPENLDGIYVRIVMSNFETNKETNKNNYNPLTNHIYHHILVPYIPPLSTINGFYHYLLCVQHFHPQRNRPSSPASLLWLWQLGGPLGGLHLQQSAGGVLEANMDSMIIDK